MDLLENAIIFLVAAVITVPIFKKLGLGTVLGYLIAGLLIGPWVLGLVTEIDDILHFAEFGVVLLLFVIGLELQPARLWLLRKPMLFIGGCQFVITTLLIYAAAVALGLSWRTALVLGMCLSLSSTAFAIQLLSERNQLLTHYGRTAFSVLLFQDIIVIPVLALLPLLSVTEAATSVGGLAQAGKAAAVIAAVVVGGHYLIRPVLRLVAGAQHPELFSAASLLVALGTAALMYSVGLSMALGAFLAGVLLADSEFRHELEANIEPFKGLLLGLFFISIGMSMDLGLFVERPFVILLVALGLIAVKAGVLFLLGRLARLNSQSALSLAAVISQGGEFAFVILHEARMLEIVDPALSGLVTLAVTISMAVTPLLIGASELFQKRYLPTPDARPFDRIEDEEPRVIIIGFGRFGQIIARILRIKHIRFTALESNVEQVDFVRRYGNKVYFGDATRLDTLRSAGLDHAEIIILSIVNQEVSLKVAATVKRHFPKVKIFARARNRHHAYRLMDIGVDYVIREAFLSAVEMARNVLHGLHVPDEEARRITTGFAEYDEELLKRQHAIHHDEEQVIATVKQATRELQSLFDEDSGSKIDAQAKAEETIEKVSDAKQEKTSS